MVKKVFKKNHVMITALALMIAVAGYLNFSGSKVGEETMVDQATAMGGPEAGEDVTALLDISEEDIENAGLVEINSMDEEVVLITEDYLENGMNTSGIENTSAVEAANDVAQMEGEVAEGNELTIDSEPGEAVFTSTTSITSLASARLVKEQTRSQNRAALLEIINSPTADEASIQAATESMIALTEIAQKETAAEILLEARGFSEVVVSVTGDSADVVVGLTELTDAQCAQIIDIVSRKTGVEQENIIITPALAD